MAFTKGNGPKGFTFKEVLLTTLFERFSNGRNIKDISDDMQKMLQDERRGWGFFLKKATYYVSAAITGALVTSIFVALGLKWASLISIKFSLKEPLANRVLTSLVFFGSAARLFSTLHETDMINTRRAAYIKVNDEKWKDLTQVKEWFKNSESNFKELKDIENGLRKEYLREADDANKEKINTMFSKIHDLQVSALSSFNLLSDLPEAPRSIILFPLNRTDVHNISHKVLMLFSKS